MSGNSSIGEQRAPESSNAENVEKKQQLTDKDYIRELERENFDLVAKCIELIEVIGWDEDGTYTFKNGERWAEFKPNPKLTHHFKIGEV